MATLSKLGIKLYADSATLFTDLQKSKKGINKWAKTVKNSAKVAAVTFSVAGGAAAASLAALTKASLENLDTLGKQADRINASTEGLAALRHQAELTGTSYGTLDKSLSQMVKRLGEARQGSGEALKFLEAMNLSVKDLSSLTADEQYSAIAESIKGLGNAADQAAAANAVFGRSGIEMLEQLKEGKAGFEAAKIEAEKFGLAVSRVDAKMIEQANDSMTRLKRVATGLGNQIAVKLAPFIKAIADRFTEASISGKGFSEQIDSAMSVAAKAMGFVADRAQDVGRGFKTLVTTAKAAKIGAKTLFDKIATGFSPSMRGKFAATAEDFDSLGESWVSLNSDVNSARLSEKLNAEISAIKEGAAIARKELEKELEKARNSGGSSLSGGSVDDNEKSSQIDKVRAAIATETELEKQKYFELKSIAESEISDEAARNEALLTLATQHKERLSQIAGIPALRQELEQAKQLRAASYLTEREQEIVAHQGRLENLRLLQEQEGIEKSLYNEAKELAELSHQERLTEITRNEAKNRAKAEADAQRDIQSFRVATTNLGIGLLQQFAGQSKKVAIALIALEKGRAIAQVIQNTNVAASNQAALGNFGAIPFVKALGAAQIAAIAATGISQAASLGGGGGGGGGFSTPNNNAAFSQSESNQDSSSSTSSSAVQIHFNGDVLNWNENVQGQFIDMIKDAVNNKQEVIIGSDSAQYSELSDV